MSFIYSIYSIVYMCKCSLMPPLNAMGPLKYSTRNLVAICGRLWTAWILFWNPLHWNLSYIYIIFYLFTTFFLYFLWNLLCCTFFICQLKLAFLSVFFTYIKCRRYICTKIVSERSAGEHIVKSMMNYYLSKTNWIWLYLPNQRKSFLCLPVLLLYYKLNLK